MAKTAMLDGLSERVERLVSRLWGDESELVEFAPMPGGHAGNTYIIGVRGGDGAAFHAVMKIAPPNVPRRGSTDLYRQVCQTAL